MKKLIFFLPIVLVSLFSCKKSDNENPSEKSTDYLPLTVGNYWIYEDYKQDSSGAFTIFFKLDSVYVSGDTMIGNNTYAVYSNWANIIGLQYYYRDSSGYLVDQTGKKFFSVNNFTDTLSSWFIDAPFNNVYASYKMEDQNLPISVSAGTFPSNNSKEFLYLDPSVYSDSFRTSDHYYSKNVGVVKANYQYISADEKHELRLVRYHVQ